MLAQKNTHGRTGGPVDDREGRELRGAQPGAEPWYLKVLILEDTESDYYWISSMLKSIKEFDVSTTRAITISEAIELAETQSFDVALVDYRLPDGLGDEFVKRLQEGAPKCAAIMLSGDRMSEVSLYGVRSGAVAAIDKDDCNPSMLETTIRFALKNQANQVAARDQ